MYDMQKSALVATYGWREGNEKNWIEYSRSGPVTGQLHPSFDLFDSGGETVCMSVCIDAAREKLKLEHHDTLKIVDSY
jgi:hypothetical protein